MRHQGKIWVIVSCLLSLAGHPETASPQSSPPSSDLQRPHYERQDNKDRVIVFVHGLFGDAKDTWMCPPDTYWPKLLLADPKFNDFNVYVAHYDTPYAGNKMTIDQVVNSLNERLKHDEVFSKHQEVIFVAHSLGGLIVKRLLLTYRDYAGKVSVVVFYSTPQTGAQIAKFGSIFSADPLLKEMFPGDQNDYLLNLENDWIAAKYKIRRSCAYETKKTKGVLVVDRLSATRDCSENATPIHEDHINIVKPCNKDALSYIVLRNAASIKPTSPAAAEERIKRLVVMISGKLADNDTFGAGIIFAADTDHLYIATANHIVRKDSQEVHDLQVQLKFPPGKVEAELLNHLDSSLDLAVVRVDRSKQRDISFDKLPFDLVGEIKDLRRRDEINHVGYPLRQAWLSNLEPGRFDEKSGAFLKFRSRDLNTGVNGGGLFNHSWELIGLIYSDQPPDGDAVSIEAIIEKLQQWNYQVKLDTALKVGSLIGIDACPKINMKLPLGILPGICRGDYGRVEVVEVPDSAFKYSERFKARSGANAGKYYVTNEGYMYDTATKTWPHYWYGFPFPEIGPDDPEAAYKIMYNLQMSRFQIDDYYASLAVKLSPREGVGRSIEYKTSGLPYIGRQSGPTDNPDDCYLKDIITFAGAPYEAWSMLWWWFMDPKKWQSIWGYVPALRRVRRLSVSNTASSTFYGAVITPDDMGGFSGKIQHMNWKLIGVQEMLVPIAPSGIETAIMAGEPAPRPADLSSDPSIISNRGAIPVGQVGRVSWSEEERVKVGYETPGWQGDPWAPVNLKLAKRRCWVVEGTPKDPYYAYGRRVIYIDQFAYWPYWTELYDRDGEYWKTILWLDKLAYTPERDMTTRHPFWGMGIDHIGNRVGYFDPPKGSFIEYGVGFLDAAYIPPTLLAMLSAIGK